MMDVWKNKRMRTTYGLVLLTAVMLLGVAGLFVASDSSDAAVSNTIKADGGADIGTWSYDSNVLTLTATDTTKMPDTFSSVTGVDFSACTTVNVVGFSAAYHSKLQTMVDAILEPDIPINYGQDVISVNGKIGTWSMNGQTLTLEPVANTNDICTELVGMNNWANVETILIHATEKSTKAFKADQTTFLRGMATNATVIKYTGELPNWQSTNGNIWYYDCGNTLYLDSSNGSDLYAYSNNSTTIFNGYYFVDSITDINISYFTGKGGYLFKDFTNAVRISSNSIQTIDKTMLYNSGSSAVSTIQEIHFTAVTSLAANLFESFTNLVVADLPGVNSVGSKTFWKCSSLTTVNLSNSLSTIGETAFENCTALTTINTLGSITVLNNYTFKNCTSLESITLPSTLTKINYQVFYNSGITSITIPDNCTTIESSYSNMGVFENCVNLHSVVLGSGLQTIGSRAFLGSGVSGTIYFPKSLTSIGEYAFDTCTNLEGIVFHDQTGDLVINQRAFVCCTSLESIVLHSKTQITTNESVFGNCPSLTSVDIDVPKLTLGTKTFVGCIHLASVDFSKSSVSIGNYSFTTAQVYSVKTGAWVTYGRCIDLVSVTFGNLESSIGNNVFGDWTASNACSNLTYVDFGTNMKSIGEYAFCNCTNLVGASETEPGVYTPINLTQKLATLGYRSFYNCTNLTGLVLDPDCPLETISSETFCYNSNLKGTVTIPKNVVTIKSSAFNGCRNLQVVSMPGTVLDTIESNAFVNCTNLQSVTITGHGLKTIGDSAFSGCTHLEAFGFTTSQLQTIGSSAFSGCNNLSGNYVFPTTLKSIGTSSFRNCWKLGNLEFTGTSFTTIGQEAFYCDYANRETLRGPASVIIPDSLTAIGYRAFYGCTNLSTADIGWNPEIPGNFGNRTFDTCTGLVSVTLHDGILNIGTDCFLYCYSLETVVLSDTITSIPFETFYNCTSLKNVTVGDGVRTIEYKAFYNCSSLENINLNKVEYIGQPDITQSVDNHRTFYNCPNLVSITAEYAKEIYYRAFESCGALQSVRLGTTMSVFDENAIYNEGKTNVITSITLADTGTGKFFVYENGLYNDTTLVLYAGGVSQPITIHPNTKTIYERVCYKSSITGTVVIPASVQSIGMYAFYDCNYINEVILECTKADVFKTVEGTYEGVTYNYSRAFAECGAIVKLTIPNTVRVGYVFNYWYYENTGNLTDLTITGTGASGLGNYYEKYYAGTPWYRCGDSGKLAVNFTGTITTIDSYMFYKVEKIRTVTLCDSISTIGTNAFNGCSKITGLHLSNNLKNIGENAFNNCTAVTDLYCPLTFDATQIGTKFTKLKNLTISVGSGNNVGYDSVSYQDLPWTNKGSTYINEFVLSFENNVLTIGNYTFYGANIKGLTFDDELETIGQYAFAGMYNTNFTELVLPNAIDSIGEHAFRDCTLFTTAYLPITFDYAIDIFSNCPRLTYFYFTVGTNGEGHDYTSSSVSDTVWAKTALTAAVTVYIENGVKSIGEYMFYGCSSMSQGGSALGISAVTFPDSLETISAHAFENCANMNGIIFGNGLEVIEDYAFAGCGEINPAITLPVSLSALGEGSFRNCNKVTTLTIPISVNAVAHNAVPAFDGCTSIITYNFIGSASGADYSNSASNNNYYALAPWNKVLNPTLNFTDTTSIGNYMFYGMVFSGTIQKLPDTVVSIGNYAFANVTKLTTIYNQSNGAIANLTSVGEGAFMDSSLKFLNANDRVFMTSVTNVGAHAFEHSAITKVTLGTPALNISVGNYAFNECPALTAVSIDGNVDTLYYETFRSPSTDSSFISPLTTLSAPRVTNFRSSLADNFPNLATVDISGSTNFGNNAGLFRNCLNLTSVQMNTSAASAYELPAYMFAGCSKLPSVSLNKVSLIKGHEFEGCSLLTGVALTSSATIPEYAFADCVSLSNVSAPIAVTIGAHAFENTAVTAFDTTNFPLV